ncbi:MAG: hypothetical protein HY975_02220, partial [Candidatus Kerfeldbacteria bacterium]|nr:hypothetical protein [Candidatus Kerfeldbacteria bacterium]
MTKQFAIVVGWVLIITGTVNFFISSANELKIMPAHAIIHIAAGMIGVFFPKNHKGFTKWVGISAVGLAMIGFAGADRLTKFIDLPNGFNYIHAVVGIAGLFVYFGARDKGAAGVAS